MDYLPYTYYCVCSGKSTHIEKDKYMQPSPLPSPKSPDEPPPDPKANINPAAFQWTRLANAWMRDDSKPHRIFLLEHASHPEEQLLRSEVLTILGMIRERLAGHTLRDHKIAPVRLDSSLPVTLLFSWIYIYINV